MCLLLDYTQDHSELGAALNGFSLNETGPLASALEKTGQAVDATYMSTARLVNSHFRHSCTNTLSSYHHTGPRARTELGRASSRIFSVRIHYQETAYIPPPETRPV
jgi:hypothetical protein